MIVGIVLLLSLALLPVGCFFRGPLKVSRSRCSSSATVNHLWESVRETKIRRETVERIVNSNVETVTKLTPRELKTAMAICVDTNSELLFRSLIRKLHAADVLTTELMSIALRLASRRRNPVMATTVLKETKLLGYATDIDNINSVVEILAERNDYLPILDVARDVQRGGYGEGVVCDAALYSHLLTSSSRQASSQPLLDACRLIDTQRTFAKVKTDEQTFMEGLDVCLLRSDLTGALRVRDLFTKLHGFVQTRVYAVVLSIYLSRREGSAQAIVTEEERVAVHGMVQQALSSKLDNNPVIADLLLRYHSLGCSLPSQDGHGIAVSREAAMTRINGAAAAGSAYLQRLWNEYQSVPGTLALAALTEAVVATENPARATLLHQYYLRNRRVPPASLTQLSMLSPGDIGNSVAKLASCVTGCFWDPLRAEEQTALVHTILHEVAPALIRRAKSQPEHLRIPVRIVQVVRGLIDQGWHLLSMEELVGDFVVPCSTLRNGLEDSQAQQEHGNALKEIIDSWICADLKKHASAVSTAFVAREEGIRLLGSYFDIVKARLELESTVGDAASPDELASAGMLLLGRLALRAGTVGLFEEVRRVLLRSGVRDVVQVVPWLDALCGALERNEMVEAEPSLDILPEETAVIAVNGSICSTQAFECIAWVREQFHKQQE